MLCTVLVLACADVWPSVSTDLLLAYPIAMQGQPTHLMLVRRQDSLQQAAERACKAFRSISCVNQVVAFTRNKLQHAILQRTRPLLHAVNYSTPTQRITIGIREGDELAGLLQTCAAAHQLTEQQNAQLGALLRREWPTVPAFVSNSDSSVTGTTMEEEMRSAIQQPQTPAKRAAAHNALGEWLYSKAQEGRVSGAEKLNSTALAAVRQQFQAAHSLSPQYPIYSNNLGVALSEDKQFAEAISMFEQAIKYSTGFASAHSNAGETWMNVARAYGTGLTSNAYASERVVESYSAALRMNWSSPILYINMGEALESLGRYDEASELYQQAVRAGVWARSTQRPYPTLDRSLYAAPVHPCNRFWFCTMLEKHSDIIIKEWRSLHAAAGGTQVSINPVLDIVSTGTWSEFNINKKGRRNGTSCVAMPRTCELVEQASEATSLLPNEQGVPKQIAGEIEFLVMSPDTLLKRHCGTTNQRLTLHLGIDIPDGDLAGLRVGGQQYHWKEGEAIVFDDSYEHEAWNNGLTDRTVLYMSFWHPQLWPKLQPQTLGPI